MIADMARPRRSLVRFRVMVVTVVTLVQVPAVAVMARLLGNPWPPLSIAMLLSLPYLWSMRRPFEDRPKSALYLYGALLPFFVWWSACLTFDFLAPFSLALVAFLPVIHLKAALTGTLLLAGLAGIVGTRPGPRLVSREVPIRGLPAALDGYRIAQLSDVHCGSYTPVSRVQRWVERINALEVDLVAVTGDLITSGNTYVRAVAHALGALSARDGVFACMGNHDYFTDGESMVDALEARGLVVLRNAGLLVEREGAQLYVAGVDDTWTGRADVARALRERPPGTSTLLLAHDPNLFPHAVEHGVHLTLSGHTHGGQLAVPGLARRFNLARLITRFTNGIYQIGDSMLYVSRGAGTTGPPIRLGAPAEIAILTLRAA
jgi:predicted MPP superfamily phosphohydrolase